jgi:hypothetical protein
MANQVVYGFHHLFDRFTDSVTTVGVQAVNDAITQAMAEHNRQMNAFTGIFVRRGVEPQTVFRTPALTRNQPLDEFGRPIPIKAPGRYTVGFPIQDSGNALGFTWQESLRQTVADINNTIAAIQTGDMRWVFDHILGALFASASYTFNDADNAGTLTVMPLASGDTQVYNLFTGADAVATDTHLLAQANAIGAGADNPFPALYTELTEHPENGLAGGRIISFIPTGLKSSITGLATFNPVLLPDVQPGSGTDQLVGSLGVNVPGTVLGMEDSGVWIVEWPRLPANYIITVATGGEPPVGERIDPNPQLQGFVEMDTNQDMPWYQRNWLRKAGYGIWNRVGAAVTRIGNGTYATPTNFTVPMP